MSSLTISGRRAPHRQPCVAAFRSALVPAGVTALLSVAGMHDVCAATADSPGYTPTLYVYQKNELVDVKTFKLADRGECERRASALLELYLNHSDIEDDMRVVVRCVPVPPLSAGHRKGERSPDGESHQRVAGAEVTL